MFDTDYERTKEFLRSRLPDYLRSRGINPEAPFACLNPQHPDRHPSMSYNPHNQTVHCYNCNAAYDIFALVGQDYGISDFKQQFRKVYEMFIGPLPGTEQPQPVNVQPAGAATFGVRSEPNFEIKRPGFDSRGERLSVPTFSPLLAPRPAEPAEHARAGTGAPLKFPAGSDAEAGAYQNAPLQPGGAVFGISNQNFRPHGGSFISSSNERSFPELQEPKYNYADYLRQAAANVGKTDYFKQLNLSDEVIARFHLGYDESFAAGTDARGEQILWRAAIIPYSDFAYTARCTDLKAQDQVRARGSLGIFNEPALSKKGAVFLCADELDALSLENLSLSAAALGSSSAVRRLFELIDKAPSAERIFYVCLKEDENGAETVKALCAGLYNRKVPFKKVDLAYPSASISKALALDKAGLCYRLNHLEEFLTFQASPVIAPAAPHQFIEDAATLSKLDLSPCLYALCARPSVLRRVLNLIMQERLCRLFTFTTKSAWQFICHDLSEGAEPPAALPFESYPNAKAVLLDSTAVRTVTDKVRYALSALRLQNDGAFSAAVDITAAAPADRAALISALSALSAELMCGLLLLCPESLAEYCESVCLQTIRVEQSADGSELIFKSAALNGRPINFTRYAGY